MAIGPIARRALRDSLKARTALGDTLVRLGRPAEEPSQDKGIYLIGGRGLRRTASGGTIDREAYTLVGIAWIDVATNDDEPEAAEDGLSELLDEIEAALGEDAELGGAVEAAELTDVFDDATFPRPDGWGARATFGVTVVRRV